MRWTKFSWIDIVWINIFTKNWVFNKLVWSFPFAYDLFKSVSKWIWTWWEFMINKIIIVKLFHSIFVALNWSNYISGCMIFWVIICVIEVLSNFFKFSNISWSIEWFVWYLCRFFRCNIWLFMMFRLLNYFRSFFGNLFLMLFRGNIIVFFNLWFFICINFTN